MKNVELECACMCFRMVHTCALFRPASIAGGAGILYDFESQHSLGDRVPPRPTHEFMSL